jgi:hypothetical protein
MQSRAGLFPIWALLLAAAAAGCGDDDSPAGDVDAAGPIVDSGPPDAPAVDAGPPDAAPQPDATPVNCQSLPMSPVPRTALPGYVASEDLAFDDDGHVIESDTLNIYKTTRAGQRKTFVNNLQFRAGMRLTPAGKLIVNGDSDGTLYRIDEDGSRHPLMTGLQYPNGMEIDQQGFVYFTDQSAEKVYRVDPATGANTVITTGVPQPNGLTFNTTYDVLYIGSFCGSNGTIYQIPIDANGNPGALTTFKSGVGSGCHDGMAVDACGNVYVADYGESTIYRISADASDTRVIVNGGGSYQPNFDWGSGVGGWDPHKLYIVGVGEGLWEVDLGVDSKPR